MNRAFSNQDNFLKPGTSVKFFKQCCKHWLLWTTSYVSVLKKSDFAKLLNKSQREQQVKCDPNLRELHNNISGLHQVNCDANPSVWDRNYCWPMFKNFAKQNIPWAASWLQVLQNVNKPNFTRWLYCSVSPAKLNHLKISLCQSKLTHGLIVQRESESFLNRQDGSWNSILLENPTMACTRPLSDFSWES